MISPTDIRKIITEFSDNTLSLYLRVDPSYIENQAETPEWEIFLKNTLRDIGHTQNKDQKNTWNKINQQLDEYLISYQPAGRTLVMFFDENEQYIQELPFAMESRSHFGKPMVSPLLWAMDEYEQYLIVMIDSQQAIVRKAYLGNLETESEMTIDLDYDWQQKTLMPVTASAPSANADGRSFRVGNNREAFEDMIAVHVDRFHKEVAEEIQSIIQDEQPMRVIIGGDERSAHAVKDHLHSSVLNNFVAIIPVSMKSNEREVMEKVRPIAYNYERDFEFDLIDEIIGMAKADGRGALGRDDVRRAMEMQQVEMVILPYSLLQDDPEYAHDLALWALENNSKVEFVHGQAATKLEDHDNIAARLYYSIQST